MEFGKFRILSNREDQINDIEEATMLINFDHIVSIKPIRISRPNILIDGYWIRTTNGKKYRATVIPPQLEAQVNAPLKGHMKQVKLDEMSLQ
jgi:hypothetical protein